MTSFELDLLDEKSRVGAEFMASVINEIRRAAAIEKASRKITQQAIANKIGTTRPVINRQMQGLENLSGRRIAEILWALGWEPHFEARKIPTGENQFYSTKPGDFVLSLDATTGDGLAIIDRSTTANTSVEVFAKGNSRG